MDDVTRRAAHRRRAWTAHAVLSLLALVACVALTLHLGDRADLALSLLGTLIVLGVITAFVGAHLSGIPEPAEAQQPPFVSDLVRGKSAATLGSTGVDVPSDGY